MSVTKAPTVLFAWEIGGGLGHTQSIRRRAPRLRRRGIRSVAAVRNLMAAAGLDEDGIEVLQAPVWPDERYRPVSGLAGILENFGVTHPVKLRMVLKAWEHLFDQVRPDLVVADYAPGATLAARGRVPVLQCSESFPLPPDTLDAVPTNMPGPPPDDDQATMLAKINAVMGGTGRPALDRLAEVFSGVEQLVHNFPALDIYRDLRGRPAIGPFMDALPEAGGRRDGRIFAYLDRSAARAPAIAAALGPFASRLDIFAPAISRGAFRDGLGREGAIFHAELRPLAERLADAALFVSHGNAAVTAEALAIGVPHLALPDTMEKLMNGQLMERTGAGRSVKIVDRTSELSADDIRRMLEDETLAERAALQGERHREFLRSDPYAAFERACLSALDLRQ